MAHSETTKHKSVSVSVIVLAYNEAGNLPDTVRSIEEVLTGRFPEYEILIVDDGSSDDTGLVANKLSNRNGHIKALKNPQNMGCGYTFRTGVNAACYQYCWLIPGDNEISTAALEAIADKVGTADLIIPYVVNFNIRPLARRLVSWGYTTLINILFLKRLRYYNGPGVFRTDLVKSVPIVSSRGFAFMAPILLRLIRRKYSYIETGILLQPRRYGKPSINAVLNIFSALKTLLGLFWEINIQERFNRGNVTGRYREIA